MSGLHVLVADAAVLVRTGVKRLLAQQGGIKCVDEARSALELLEIADARAPDVILLDQDLPDLDSVEAVRLIKQSHPKTEVIVVADELDRTKAFRCLEAGAASYLLKDIDPLGLVRAVEAVSRGQTIMHPLITRYLVEHVQTLAQETGETGGLHADGLTALELRIVLEMTRGATDREIAQKLFMSTASVKSCIRTIFRKVGAQTRTQAVVRVLTHRGAAGAAEGAST